MQLSEFDLNLFVVFETVYREGSLTKAAESLKVTQPAISSSLARLRAECGDPLFVRSGRGVVPTPLARQIIEPVRTSLRLMQSSLNASAVFDPSTANVHFSVSVGDYYSTLLAPTLTGELLETAPKCIDQFSPLRSRNDRERPRRGKCGSSD